MISDEILLNAKTIQAKVMELAQRISKDYQGKEVLAICILKGAFIFFADLVRALQIPVNIDFIVASSYIDTKSTGEVKVLCDIRDDVTGKEILLIDDIIDTGVSLNYIKKHLHAKGPATIKICVLLDKKERRIVDVPIDYVGFEIPDVFVVGYGLDYNNCYRNLPHISSLKNK